MIQKMKVEETVNGKTTTWVGTNGQFQVRFDGRLKGWVAFRCGWFVRDRSRHVKIFKTEAEAIRAGSKSKRMGS